MGAAAYIGRIGGLAVALGVGAAVVTGHGVAWADEGNDAGASSSQSESSSARSDDNESAGPRANSGDADGASDDEDSDDEDSDDETEDDADEDSLDEEPADDDVVDDTEAPEQELDEDTTPQDEDDSAPTEPAVDEPVDTGEDAVDENASNDGSDRRTGLADRAIDTQAAAAVADESPTVDAESDATETDTTETAADDVVTQESVATASADSIVTVTNDSASIAPAAASAGTTPAPTAAAVTQIQREISTVRTFVRGLFAKFGFGAESGDTPEAPVQNPALWAVLAWTRREFERGATTEAAKAATPVATATTGEQIAAAAVPPGSITYVPDLTGYTQVRGWVTGPATQQLDPFNRTLERFDIYGTDLGIMWDNGLTGPQNQVLMAFGDTFSQAGMTGNWRSNVLLRSSDRLLDNGLGVGPGSTSDIFSGSPLSPNGGSEQLVNGIPGTIGLFGIPSFFGSEVTMIPTAGVSVPYDNDLGSRQYMNVMSVRQWGPAGMWTTNYSAIAYSDDNGQSWKLDPDTIRSAGYLRTWGHSYVEGNDNFQQGAFVRGVEVDANGLAVRDANGDVVHDGYVYSYGTPSGRFGSAYLSRVPEDDILELDSYEYWNGSGWSDSPGDAAPVIPSDPSPFSPVISFLNNIAGLFGIPATIPNGDVSEISVQYNEYLDEYIILYTDGSGQVVMRTANTPEEAWSEKTVLANSTRFPGLYAPMIHPWSGTDKIDDDPQYLYWNLSQWDQYNVEFIKTDLSPMKTVAV